MAHIPLSGRCHSQRLILFSFASKDSALIYKKIDKSRGLKPAKKRLNSQSGTEVQRQRNRVSGV